MCALQYCVRAILGVCHGVDRILPGLAKRWKVEMSAIRALRFGDGGECVDSLELAIRPRGRFIEYFCRGRIMERMADDAMALLGKSTRQVTVA